MLNIFRLLSFPLSLSLSLSLSFAESVPYLYGRDSTGQSWYTSAFSKTTGRKKGHLCRPTKQLVSTFLFPRRRKRNASSQHPQTHKTPNYIKGKWLCVWPNLLILNELFLMVRPFTLSTLSLSVSSSSGKSESAFGSDPFRRAEAICVALHPSTHAGRHVSLLFFLAFHLDFQGILTTRFVLSAFVKSTFRVSIRRNETDTQ